MGYYLTPLLLLLITVAVMDFKYRKVKNILFLFGIFYAFFLSYIEWRQSLGEHVAAGFLIFSILLIFYILKGMGAGDVKFGAVVGLFWGLSSDLMSVMLIALILSMFHSILFLNIKNKNIYFLSFLEFIGFDNGCINQIMNLSMRKSIPFAAYLAIASIFWMLYESPP